jgi:hypothetical protein
MTSPESKGLLKVLKKIKKKKNFFKKFSNFFFWVPSFPNTLRLSSGLSNVLLLNSLSDQPAKKQILWRRSIKVEFGHFFTFHQFFSPKFLVKFWNFFFSRGVIDYAEFKKNKISVIRQRLNGAQFRVFTLPIDLARVTVLDERRHVC